MDDAALVRLARRNRWYLPLGTGFILAALLVWPLGRYMGQDIASVQQEVRQFTERSILPRTPLEKNLKAQLLEATDIRQGQSREIYRDRIILVSALFFVVGIFLIAMFARPARHFGFPFRPPHHPPFPWEKRKPG